MPDTRIAISCLLLLAASWSQAQQMPARAVQISTVSEAEVAPTVAVPGTIYSRNEVQITAGVAGRLVMVAEPGTVVEKGDYVARIDKRSLRLQRAEQEALLERASIIEVRIRQIDDLLQRADVRAPFSGVVIDRVRRSGEEVARGEVLGQLTDTENLEVRAFVPLKHLPRTATGQAIDIFATDAAHAGTIRSLVPTGDVRSQTFEARIDLPADATRDWTVGQLVSVAIPIRARRLELAVPRDALVLRQEGSFVFRINAENKAEQVKVEIGDSAGELVAVRGELAAGDRVAIRGAENLSEGADVRILVSETASAGSADAARNSSG